MGANRLPDRRDHRDPDVGLAVEGDVDALAVRRIGGRLTITSMLCGVAWDINSMILFRGLQGALGAAMIPTVFTTAFVLFPASSG